MIIIYSVVIVVLIVFIGWLVFAYSKAFRNLKTHIENVKEISEKNQKRIDMEELKLKLLMHEIENRNNKDTNNFTKKNV